MKALNNPTAQEALFYAAHSKTRRLVECAFGVLKMRFRCLFEGLRCKDPVFACEIIKACTVLHNLALSWDPVDVSDELDRMNDERAAPGAVLNAHGLESEVPTTEDDDESVDNVPPNVGRVTQLMQLFHSLRN